VKTAGLDNVEIVELEVVNADIEHTEPKQSYFDSNKNPTQQKSDFNDEMEEILYEEN